jgi:hypothetical protein
MTARFFSKSTKYPLIDRALMFVRFAHDNGVPVN